MLNATGPSLNQVSSLNSSVGEKTPRRDGRGLVRLEAEDDDEEDQPEQPDREDRQATLPVLIGLGSSGSLIGGSACWSALIAPSSVVVGGPLMTRIDERDRVRAEDHERGGEPVRAAAGDARRR